MVTLTTPITVAQVRELARQLSPQDRRALIESLLAERFDAVLADSDRQRGTQPVLTDAQIQAEVDAVRGSRREERRRAAGG